MSTEISTVMLDEIREQPALLRSILDRRAQLTADFVKLYCETPIKRVFFVGNGSPYYVCLLYTSIDTLRDALAQNPGLTEKQLQALCDAFWRGEQ